MKKTLIIFLAFILFAPAVMAATIYSEYETVADKYQLKEMAPITITSTSDGDITAEHGIRILLASNQQILWDDTQPGFITGTAKDNGKVDLNVKLEFSEDYKSVFIPVKENWAATDWLNIIGLYVRAYDEKFEPQKLGMDLNGDGVADVTDINDYRVGSNAKSDVVAPYPVQNVEYTVNADGSVTFTWNQPPDYDYDGTAVNRDRVKNGQHQLSLVYNDYATTFTDSDLSGVTSATYDFYSKDLNGNQGAPVEVVVDFTAPEPVTEPVAEPEEPVAEPVEEPADEPAAEPVASEDEVSELSRLLNYYNVRYSIKCMPSGVAVASNNSACLWARIDLIYAQELTGEDKVPGLALSDRDLELMATRRQWPEKRYEDNCVAVNESAAYCPALGKALDRISYFLD